MLKNELGQCVWKRSIPWSGGKTVGNDQVESACGVAKDWVTRGFLNATLNGTWRLMYSLGDTSTVVIYSL